MVCLITNPGVSGLRVGYEVPGLLPVLEDIPPYYATLKLFSTIKSSTNEGDILLFYENIATCLKWTNLLDI